MFSGLMYLLSANQIDLEDVSNPFQLFFLENSGKILMVLGCFTLLSIDPQKDWLANF